MSAELTLVEFLRARLDEDAEVAQAAGGGVWSRSTTSYDGARVEGDGMVIYDEGGHTVQHAEHIARHDPARVLADVEAKRRIITEHEPRDDPGLHLCPVCVSVELARAAEPGEDLPLNPAPCLTLQLLALPYAGHDDYRAEWKP